MRRFIVVAGLIVGVSVVCLFGYIAQPLPPSRAEYQSHLILSESGERLATRLSHDGYWREQARLDEIDPKLVEVLIAYEDQRFWSHWGVDPLALARAVFDLLRTGRISSGASTLTMQTARLMYPELGRKAVSAKLQQMATALRIEAHLSKQDILETYFTLAPYGGNVEGIQAASYAWLNRSPKHLTYREAAFFVALPQSPEVRRPDHNLSKAESSTSRVLETVAGRIGLSASRLQELQSETIPIRKRAGEAGHPHLVDRLSTIYGGAHHTTLSAEWQARLSQLVKSHLASMPQDLNSAALIVERRTGKVRAYIGSSDYSNRRRKGANNYLQAIRSPGSTLKPLIYGLALDRGLIQSNSVLSDTRIQVEGYAPSNFDGGYAGQARLRDALIQSLNIPAINTLSRLGPKLVEQQIVTYLQLAENQVNDPGLSLAVGGLSLTPEQVAQLYLGWTNQPVPELSLIDDEHSHYREPLITSKTSQTLMSLMVQTDLSGNRYVVKTGTSSGHRDAWSAHILEGYLVLVWVGAPDNIGYPSMTGASTAMPLGFEIIRALGLKAPNVTQLIPAAVLPKQVIETACKRLVEYPEHDEWIVTNDLSVAVGSRYSGVKWYLNGIPVELQNNTMKLSHLGANVISAKHDGCLTSVSVFVAPN